MSNENNYPSVNIISEGSELEGFLKSEHDIRVGGVLNGTLETGAKVIVSEKGNITGGMVCQNADIAGKITGDVIGKNKVTLRKSAILEGNLTTKILVVEEGAKVIGLCRMGDKTMTSDEEYVDRVLKDVR
ncbi:MAG: hypothetical protein CL672_05650 [Balneola sp.]|nr:hypothetical protein [Balneola sp.]|tara:strand:- start:14945 stop:15334 length:390 start_codon:yes stop_codon:yes gene_type:complete